MVSNPSHRGCHAGQSRPQAILHRYQPHLLGTPGTSLAFGAFAVTDTTGLFVPFHCAMSGIHLNPEVLDGIRQLPRLQTYSLIIEWLAGQVQLVVLARLLASAALSV